VKPKIKPKKIKLKLECPFKNARQYCTYVRNKNLTKKGKRAKCIYTVFNCPYLKDITGESNVKITH
jgi:hypothetical protein